jgi:ABC-2 type transport system ATP-binding protein
MIEVSQLTKRYAGSTAVDAISFKVGKGEIVGFLGPNGAGKSTTIKMLTCFLTPTSGSARIGGFDIEKDSIQVRRRIGYMPENVPLYPDMRVHEYLKFRGALKGLTAKKLSDGMGEAIEICSLKEVENKIIGTLSKGYRQRVGLADALVNKPDLLILDEPTNGLDPQQIRHFRELIKDLGKRHTIFLSTHILPEVEMTCDRLLIIHRGKLLASDTPQGLVRRRLEGGDLIVELDANPGKASAALKKLKGVTSVDEERNLGGWVRYKIASKGSPDLAEKVFELAIERKWKIREMSRRDVSLEDAFVDLVKGEGAV